MYVCMYVNYNQ